MLKYENDFRLAPLTQQVEYLHGKQKVAGSNPAEGYHQPKKHLCSLPLKTMGSSLPFRCRLSPKVKGKRNWEEGFVFFLSPL